MGKLRIRVKPNSNRNKIVKMADGTFKIWLKSTPEKGKANKELARYLKKRTGVPIKILAGKTSRNKLIEFALSEEKFAEKLEGD